MKHLYPIICLILCLSVIACRKSISNSQSPTSQTTDSTTKPNQKSDSVTVSEAPYPQAPVTGCSYAPNYGDTIIYPQPTTGQDYIVSPINNPGPGKYLSWPIGMVIDSITGAINVTKSETGLKYAIGFVKEGTTDTCLNYLIIGGAAYMDSVYVLGDGQTQALPYFDANPNLLSVCASGNGCSFDVTGSAASHKVIVNTITGVIDLQKTLNGGLLGGAFGLLPINGSSITVPIYYRLNDPSNNALQHIDVQLVYYDKKSLINLTLLNTLLNRLNNLTSGNMISTYSDPRPPLIIITRSR